MSQNQPSPHAITIQSLLAQIEEIKKLSASTNPLIAKLQTDVSNLQQTTNQTDTVVQAFLTNLQTFFASLQSSGTVLSAADQAALTALDGTIGSVSTASTAVTSAVNAISIPSV